MTADGVVRRLRRLAGRVVVRQRVFRRSAAGRLRSATATRQGPTRRVNEDVCLIDESRALFAVADGMGGHPAGDVASRVAIAALPELVDRELLTVGPKAAPDALRAAVGRAVAATSDAVLKEATRSADLTGMGSTLVMILVRSDDAYVAHVGDSRAHLLRNGQIRRLTDDHSLFTALLRRGHSPEEAARHPMAHRLMQGLGTAVEVRPTVCQLPLLPGDRLLLCSDGLTGVVAEGELGRVLGSAPDPRTACDLLLRAAAAAGTRDDTSVVVVDVPARR